MTKIEEFTFVEKEIDSNTKNSLGQSLRGMRFVEPDPEHIRYILKLIPPRIAMVDVKGLSRYSEIKHISENSKSKIVILIYPDGAFRYGEHNDPKGAVAWLLVLPEKRKRFHFLNNLFSKILRKNKNEQYARFRCFQSL